MLGKLVKKIESRKRPLLGPNVKALKFWGLLLPENVKMQYFYMCMHILVIIFTATEYVDIWFIKSNINLLLNNLKTTMISTVSVLKVTTFLCWQKTWKNIIEYVTRSDLVQRNENNDRKNSIIDKYTKYCRKITYFYWILICITIINTITQPIYKFISSPIYRETVKNGTESYMQVISSWVPFDKNTVIGYIFASIYQSYGAIYGGGWTLAYDTNIIVIMVFFKCELELLKLDCGEFFGDKTKPVSDDTALLQLKRCHKRYEELIKYAKLFDSVLSPIMLLYMFVCSVMLCASAYQITVETNAGQRLLMTEFLIFGVAQLFLYCWHSNDVYYASLEVIQGPYNSLWWNRGKSRQKEIQILIGQLNRPVVFSAGPFTDLSVPTFINILKWAYSYYTLLRQSQQNASAE